MRPKLQQPLEGTRLGSVSAVEKEKVNGTWHKAGSVEQSGEWNRLTKVEVPRYM